MQMLFRRGLICLTLILLVGCSPIEMIRTRLSFAPQQNVIVGDATRGKELFLAGTDNAPPCSGCHQVGQSNSLSLAPNLMGVATRASERDLDLTPEAYIIESIIDPQRYKVPGFRVTMYDGYSDDLTEQDIADLVAYLMSA